jgi:phosphoribosyl 1,2-cyclic phosphodiesterase
MLPVTTPDKKRIEYHLCTEDAISFVDIVKPEKVLIIHLGIVMIKRDPNKQAAIIEKSTGIKTIAVKDLDVLTVGKRLSFSRPKTYDDEWIPDTSP